MGAAADRAEGAATCCPHTSSTGRRVLAVNGGVVRLPGGTLPIVKMDKQVDGAMLPMVALPGMAPVAAGVDPDHRLDPTCLLHHPPARPRGEGRGPNVRVVGQARALEGLAYGLT